MHKTDPKSRVLVTGGAGFIGSHLADRLLDSGYSVTVLDNLSNGSLENISAANSKEHFYFYEGDILDKEDCFNASTGIDYVFHLACLGVRHSIHSPFENHRVNAEGTLNMLEAARASGVKHFFYISTSEIYGRTTDFPITESAPTNPLTVYGASKLAGEHYSKAYYECYGLPVTVFRIFNNYGPRAHYEGDAGEVIPRSIIKALYDEAPIIFGDGSVTRDFFYVKDTADALLQFLELSQGARKKEITGETINIGTGREISIKELLESLLASMNRSYLGIKFLPDRPADVPRLWVKADKFKEYTGFIPSYDFKKGLEETIAYYEEKVANTNLLSDIKDTNWVK